MVVVRGEGGPKLSQFAVVGFVRKCALPGLDPLRSIGGRQSCGAVDQYSCDHQIEWIATAWPWLSNTFGKIAKEICSDTFSMEKRMHAYKKPQISLI